MRVGPLHSIGEVAEGNEVMERRGRQEGITTEQAKGRPTAVTPHGGFCGGKSQQWLCYPTMPNVRFCVGGGQ
jgi:hypothetical protein